MEREIINLTREDTEGAPVIINNEAGAIVTVNLNTHNSYNYSYPDWFDRDALIAILRAVRG